MSVPPVEFPAAQPNARTPAQPNARTNERSN